MENINVPNVVNTGLIVTRTRTVNLRSLSSVAPIYSKYSELIVIYLQNPHIHPSTPRTTPPTAALTRAISAFGSFPWSKNA